MWHRVEPNLPFHFVHLPKTGGSSVNHALSTIAAAKYFNIISLKGSHVLDLNIEKNLLDMKADFLINHKPWMFSTAHIPFIKAKKILGRANFFTVLRDPINRYLSDYCSNNKNIDDFGLSSFTEQVDKWSGKKNVPIYLTDNLMTKILGRTDNLHSPCTEKDFDNARNNLDSFSGIFFTKSVTELIASLYTMFGLEHKDKNYQNVTGNYQQFLNEEHRDLAIRQNSYDVMLKDLIHENQKQDIEISNFSFYEKTYVSNDQCFSIFDGLTKTSQEFIRKMKS